MAPGTQLQRLLPELLGVPDMGEVLHVTTRRESIWHHGHLAALAPRLMELFGVDHVLTEIVQAMAPHVAQYVDVVRQRCGLGADLDVAVGGGMVRGALQVGELVRDQIIRALPRANVTLTSGTALDGAILTVLAEAGQRVNSEVAKTGPGSS